LVGHRLLSRTVKARHSRLLVLALALAGSQAGHLLVYQLRFGAAAQQVQSTGAHAYFPALVKTGLGLACALLVAGLFVVALARVASRRPLDRGAAPSLLRLVAVLYTIQLAVFAGQETAEAAVAGTQASSIAVLLLWGTLGQLPVALVGAAALRWLLVRFESAVAALGATLAVLTPRPRLALALAPVVIESHRDRLVSRVADTALLDRGPPPGLRISQT